MQFEDRTLTILKNFSTINPSIIVNPGDTITTMATDKSMLATAKVSEEFDTTFAIYDLNRFLGVLSLFDAPDVIINEKFATIKSGSKKLNYVFASVDTIQAPKNNSIALEDIVEEFEFTANNFKDILRAADVLKVPEIAFVGEAGKLIARAFNSEDPTGDVYDLVIKEIENDFTFIFPTESFRLIQQDYKIKIDSRGIAQFTGNDIDYWIAVKHTSKSK